MPEVSGKIIHRGGLKNGYDECAGLFRLLYYDIRSSNSPISFDCFDEESKKRKNDLFKVKYESFDHKNFDRTFSITCEYCGGSFNTVNRMCPKCGGNYERNAEYLKKKKENDWKYLSYLRQMEENIKVETENILKTKKYLKTNVLMNARIYNFDVAESLPRYVPKNSFTFSCEYCGREIIGRSWDKSSCSSCGAGYSDNVELLVFEEEDRVEKALYSKAQANRDIMLEQNEVNRIKDVKLNKYPGLKALLMLAALFAVGIILCTILF